MEIHWHEGLFLLPHHLQRLQRNLQGGLKQDRRLAWSYPYGVIEAKISPDNLENMQLRFDKLRALMPSGTEVSFPEHADLPSRGMKEALDASGSVTVHLAIPTYTPARQNVLLDDQNRDSRAKILYRVEEAEWPDENTGGNPKTLLQRKVNARLIFDDEDTSDLETIPLLRVSRGTGEEVGLPHRDQEFVGPCLILTGSNALSELVRDLVGQIQASREELILQINRGGFSMDTLRGIQIEQIFRLKTLSRFSARLAAQIAVPSATPFQMYLELIDLLAELEALHPDHDMGDIPAYDHDAPWFCFSELARRIRIFLRGTVAPNFIRVPFILQDGLLTASLTDEHFTTPTDYLLGITTKQDPLSLARFVENRDEFKLMPTSMANRAVRGVPLEEERFPPLQLPSHTGLYYFRVLHHDSREVWDLIKNEKSAIVRWTENESADYQVALYMTVASSV